MYSQRVRIFGPKSPKPYLIGLPIQRGEGWASFFSGVARKILPVTSRGIKSFVNAASDIVSNVIEGKENPLDEAKNRLQETRKEIADTIRKRKFTVTKDTQPSMKKRKKHKPKLKKKKKYNLFDEFEDV